jgi:hypothetical protein
MTAPISATKVIFSDDFSTNGPISSARWDYNHWNADPSKNGSFYGNTQQRQELAKAQDGALRLRLDTYNPSDRNHTTFLGSEAISTQTFSVGAGLAFEAKARYAQTQPGIIGGFFTFAGPADTHDEIDFEALSNDNSKIQTNIYHHEPLGEGHPESFPVTGSLTDYHTYRIEWLPDAVRWLVDGVVVRTEAQRVPDKAMNLHLNIWGPPAFWPTGSDTLKAAASPGQNQTFEFWIDSVKVEQLSGIVGTRGAEVLSGTAKHDWIDGLHGRDELFGGRGNDTMLGGNGNDTIYGQSGNDHLQGGNGNEQLWGGRGNDLLEGGNGQDSLHGGDGGDQLLGGTGRDLLNGGGGHDTLNGGSSHDDLLGGSGRDVVNGDSGRDQLTGGAGADRLTGGDGADSFIYTALTDSRADPAGRDAILDFSRKQGDTMDFSALDANPTLDGDQAFTFIGASAFTGAAGELQVRPGTGRTFVRGDLNGDGVADFVVQLKGVIPLTASDFVL